MQQSQCLVLPPADIDECEPTNDCMQKCINSIGSYNCSCDEFFKPDPTDWRKCSGMILCVFFPPWRMMYSLILDYSLISPFMSNCNFFDETSHFTAANTNPTMLGEFTR